MPCVDKPDWRCPFHSRLIGLITRLASREIEVYPRRKAFQHTWNDEKLSDANGTESSA